MNALTSPRSRMILAALTLTLIPALAPAQDTGVDVMEIARQVRRNMINVEESLMELGDEAARKSGSQAAKDLEKLVDGKGDSNSSLRKKISQRGEQVVKDMDAMIKSFKSSGGGGGGQQEQEQEGEGKQGQKPGSSRDRNKSEQSGEKPEGSSKPGEQEGEQKGEKKGQKEDNTRPNPQSGDDLESGNRQYPDPEKARHVNLLRRWGTLPPEKRQRLIDRNFRDFTPEYEREIRAYFKKIARRR